MSEKPERFCGPDFITPRLSMIDLVEEGSIWEEVVHLAKKSRTVWCIDHQHRYWLWHEARVPTIATSVPRGSFMGHTQTQGRNSNTVGNIESNQHATYS